MSDGIFKWYYGPGTDPEHCKGPFDTKAEAENEARADYGDEEVFTVLEADKLSASLDGVFDFDQIMSRFEEVNEDMWGEDGMDSIDATRVEQADLLADLEKALEAWFKRCNKKPKAYNFGTTRNSETFNEEAEG